RINGNTWAISARGFNGAYSNKLLVMVDGRTIYTPLFSGVFWDAQDTLIEDIDRIEVIRGPVAPLWGANAVNGAIHIITRTADQTQGVLVSAGGGNEDISRAGLRFGGSAGANTAYRIYGQSSARTQRAPYGTSFQGGTWGSAQGGFRVDRRISDDEELTVQGDVYRELGNLFTQYPLRQAPFDAISTNPLESSGGNLLGRWTRRHAAGGQTVAQTYYDRLVRGNIRDSNSSFQTADLDVQHWFPAIGRHEWMAGGGYRQMWDQTRASTFSRLLPESKHYGTAYLSLVDEIELLPDRLAVTLGIRAERNSLSGYNLQPTARIWWAPAKRQSLWGAWTRAVRTPSRGELGFQSDLAAFSQPPFPAVLVAYGNKNMRPETSNAFDAGYRIEFRRLSLDVSAFRYLYRSLRTLDLGRPQFEFGPQPIVLLPAVIGNGNRGDSYGAEVATTIELPGHSRIRASYGGLSTRTYSADGVTGFAIGELSSPQNQWQVRWQADLPRRYQLDVWAPYVGSTTSLAQVPGRSVPGYTRLDVHLSRRFLEG
ncbi:MAG: TonB-dependent receptor, partial [Bryobacteraceae bacterium]